MIYIDLLVFEDLILNYIILLATGILLNRITNFKKPIVLGRVLSLLILKVDIITNTLRENMIVKKL